jgi:hypothetical protein
MSKTAVVKSRTRAAVVRSTAWEASRNSLNCLSWRLPSGEGLADFALRFGFLAPSLMAENGSAPARSRRQEARG